MKDKIPENIFKSYDIRGIYPDEINERNVVPISNAIYAFAKGFYPKKDSLSVVVGRDMRISTPAIFEAVTKTLLNAGAEVIDPGLVATTTFYHIIYGYGYDSGIMITASHNPWDYNGLKIVVNSPQGLIKVGADTGMDEIKRLSYANEDITEKEGKRVYIQGVLEDEYKKSVAIAGHPEIKPFIVVADPANAMGGPYLEHMFKHVPGELIKMNFDLDGTFPAHASNPFDFTTLVDLQKKVVEEGADIGLAPDGDGDRMFFVDEKGQIIPSSIITALAIREILKDKPGEKIVGDMKYQLTPKYWVEKMGGEFVVSRTGHTFMTEMIQRTGALFGGEASGHYYFKQTGGADAQIPMVLMVLGVMSRENKPLSEIAAKLKKSEESGELNYKVRNADEIIDKVKLEYAGGEFSDLDGIAYSYPDWRFSLRNSNTEPVLRLNIEGRHLQAMNEAKNRLVDLVEKYGEK